MKKKEVIIVLIILIITMLAIAIASFFNDSKNEEKNGVVVFKDKVILEFNIYEDAYYDLRGTYGKLHLEVKDGKWRITKEECPNHICSKMGWVDENSFLPIWCLPNEVGVIYNHDEE